jgi:hypothetical protein
VGEDVVGVRQARLVHQALTAAGIEVVQLWWEYVLHGGEATAIEVEAYLRHRLWLPPEDQDLLARAAHGLLAGAVDPPVPGTGDLLGLGVIPGAAPHHGTPLRRVGN